MNYASIVWDGKTFTVPDALGKPREDQLASTPLDNLAELSGRTCYDSLGSGRKTTEYHAHIIEVGHGSVQEHSNLTFLIPNLTVPDFLACCESLLNRPGIYVRKIMKKSTIVQPGQPPLLFDLRITANMRAVREWFKVPLMNQWSQLLGETLQNLAKENCPFMFCDIPRHDVGANDCRVVEPEVDEETWVSMFFTNVSRGFSHELVRHKYRTAVSQRSTRYVDENESPWAWHPLMDKFLHGTDVKDEAVQLWVKSQQSEKLAKDTYAELVKFLQQKCIDGGVDKFTARKQARGAARGILGNALMTEMIFSASLDQWKWMFHLRASRHADAEIRVVFNEVYELLSARFPDRFIGWTKNDCPDGIGYELVAPPRTAESTTG
jgi:thymidylate synthase ThyX